MKPVDQLTHVEYEEERQAAITQLYGLFETEPDKLNRVLKERKWDAPLRLLNLSAAREILAAMEAT